MDHFLAFQHTNTGIQVGLFVRDKFVQSMSDDKKHASKNIILLTNKLLRENNISLENIVFFAANQGPGPFTTLRVVITTVNGLAFASKKPIVGIDGIEAILLEHDKKSPATTVAILNAYSGDVYFGIQSKKNIDYKKGYKNNEILFYKLKKDFPYENIRFIGQATELYEKEIQQIFDGHAIIEKNISNCSIEQIGLMAWENWNKNKNVTNHISPLYLKNIQLSAKKPSQL